MKSPNAFLFDVDFTLVDATDIHLQAYHEAFKGIYEQTGLRFSDEVIKKPWEKLTSECIRGPLQAYNVPYTEELIQELVEKYRSGLPKFLKENPKGVKLLPGVKETLEELVKRRALRGVASGNKLENIGFLLGSVNINHYFSSISGGDSPKVKERSDILKNALSQFKSKIKRVYVIGDSPSDVQAAKKISAFSIGVATGQHTVDQLMEEGADLALENLESYEKILELID